MPAPSHAPRSLLLLCLLVLRGCAQDFGQTRFICTSVPLDVDMCSASSSAPAQGGGAEELRSTVLQLRESVLQQKETILNQKETIRELTAKLGRCESQSLLDALPNEAKPGGRKPGGFPKNTMGDLSRAPAAETLHQLGQTLQALKARLENLEVPAPEPPGPARRGWVTGRRGWVTGRFSPVCSSSADSTRPARAAA